MGKGGGGSTCPWKWSSRIKGKKGSSQMLLSPALFLPSLRPLTSPWHDEMLLERQEGGLDMLFISPDGKPHPQPDLGDRNTATVNPTAYG